LASFAVIAGSAESLDRRTHTNQCRKAATTNKSSNAHPTKVATSALRDALLNNPIVGVRVQFRVGTCRKGALDAPAVTSVSVFDKRPGHIHIEETPLDHLPALLGDIRR
jgi:hypothetical protein